jgi:hypothetical protein
MPVWFMVVTHVVPIAWQEPQLVLFIGATVCGFVVLTPAAGGALPAVL